jgi:hypothetical protein
MKNFKQLLGPVEIMVLALIISTSISLAFAGSYAEPGCAPTGCNADSPLNTSGASQIKVGRLTVASGSGIQTGLEVVWGNVQVDNGGYFYSSDRNKKTNITALNNALDKVLQLNGVSYNLKSNGQVGVGLIAQDVEKVYPEVVTVGNDGYLQVDYGRLVGPLVEAIKAQQIEINQLKAEIDQFKANKY